MNGIPRNFWIQFPDLTFDREKHIYQWKEKKVDSVTQIMDRIGTRENDQSPWKSIGCPDFAKTEHDQNFGLALHKYITYIFWDFEPKYPDELKPWIRQFENFMCDHPIIPLYDKNHRPIVEYPMYSKNGYAGEIDFAGLYRKKDIWLIDWKSSGSYMPGYAWQTAAYEQLLRETFGGVLFDKRAKIYRFTVLLTKEKYNPKHSDNPVDWIMFQSFMNILRKK